MVNVTIVSPKELKRYEIRDSHPEKKNILGLLNILPKRGIRSTTKLVFTEKSDFMKRKKH